MKKVISTVKAPAAIGPYSQATQVGNIVYTSGQIPIDPATGVFVGGRYQGTNPPVFAQREGHSGRSRADNGKHRKDYGVHGRYE